MPAYIVNTPGNPDYNGKVFGIPFSNGRAIVSKETVNKKLGWTVEQIVNAMKKDFGYDVLEIAGFGEPEKQTGGDANISLNESKAEAEKAEAPIGEAGRLAELARAEEVSTEPVSEVNPKEEKPKVRNASKRRE